MSEAKSGPSGVPPPFRLETSPTARDSNASGQARLLAITCSRFVGPNALKSDRLSGDVGIRKDNHGLWGVEHSHSPVERGQALRMLVKRTQGDGATMPIGQPLDFATTPIHFLYVVHSFMRKSGCNDFKEPRNRWFDSHVNRIGHLIVHELLCGQRTLRNGVNEVPHACIS